MIKFILVLLCLFRASLVQADTLPEAELIAGSYSNDDATSFLTNVMVVEWAGSLYLKANLKFFENLSTEKVYSQLHRSPLEGVVYRADIKTVTYSWWSRRVCEFPSYIYFNLVDKKVFVNRSGPSVIDIDFCKSYGWEENIIEAPYQRIEPPESTVPLFTSGMVSLTDGTQSSVVTGIGLRGFNK